MKTIKLTKGLSAIVDDEMFMSMNIYKWNITHNSRGHLYARRTLKKGGKVKHLRMHREVIGAKPGEWVDHINGNTLDNRKSNLRICTASINALNRKKKPRRKGSVPTSQFVGVYYFPPTGRWVSQLMVNGKVVHKKYFLSEKEAAEARRVAVNTYALGLTRG